MRTWIPALLVVFAMTSHGQSDKSIDAPSYRVGDSWRFQHISNRSGLFRISLQTVKTVKADLIEVESERLDVPEPSELSEWKIGEGPLIFPMFVSKKWQSPIFRRGAKVGEASYVVLGWETVNTPAGKFEALKIDSIYAIPEGRFHQQLWYAPLVRNFVKITYVDEKGSWTQYKELVSYRIE